MGIDVSSDLSRFESISQNSSLPRVDASDKDKLRETAKEFEAIFVKQMLDSMKQTLNKDDRLVDGGIGEDIFSDMLYTEYSRIMAKAGDFGIAKSIVGQYGKFIGDDSKPAK